MDAAQSNIEVVDAAFKALNEGDLKGAGGRFEEDARWGVAQSLPGAGTHEGRAGILSYLEGIQKRFGGKYKLLHLSLYGTSDRVFAEFTRTNGKDAYSKGSEHVLLNLHVVMGKIRDVREFAYAVH